MIFKKVQQVENFDRLMEKVDAIENEPDAPSLNEISEMVKSVRQGTARSQGYDRFGGSVGGRY